MKGPKAETHDEYLIWISQKYSSKEDNGDPLGREKLAILHDQFILMLLIQRKTNILLQKVLLCTVKVSYSILSSCDWFMLNQFDFTRELQRIFKSMLEALAFFRTTSQEINFLRRDLIKCRLPGNRKPLAKDVPADSELLFWG